MKPKTIPILLGALVLASVALAVVYWTKKPAETAPAEQTAAATSQTEPPSANTAADTAKLPETNMNADFTADQNGLSKATVVMKTNKGTIKFKFYSSDAPNHTKRIAELINQSFYNGLKFHRVIPNFVAQGGDPTGSGSGGSGKNIKAEFNKRRHMEGAVGMARASDPDSADSQFYFVLAPQPHLDSGYTVFGQVTEGMDVVKSLAVGDTMDQVVIQ